MFRFFVSLLLLFAALSTPCAAFAQTSAVVQTIDLSFWLQLLLSVSAIAVPFILALVAAWMKSHFKLAASSNAANILDLAVTAGQQYVAAAIARAPTTAVVAIKQQAIANFLEMVSASTKAAMVSEGWTSSMIAQRIDGAVSSALGLPSTPASTPAPAAPAAPAST